MCDDGLMGAFAMRVSGFTKMAVDIEKAAEMYKSISPRTRLIYSIGLFVFAAGGLYVSNKLDEMLPATDRTKTIQEWKQKNESSVKSELE